MTTETHGGIARSSSTPPGRTKLPGFDGLRAVAATSVVVLHASFRYVTAHRSAFDLVVQLQSGVQIFFVLSGFLLARPFVAAVLDGAPLPSLRAYGRNRFLRLFPAYWAALFLSAAFLDVRVGSWFDWVVHLALQQVYSFHGIALGITASWTLSCELAFYVFLPIFFGVVVLGARRFDPFRVLMLAVGLVFVGGIGFVLWAGLRPDPLASYWPPFNVSVFILGVACAAIDAQIARTGRGRGVADTIGHLGIACWLLAGAILVVLGARYGATLAYHASHLIPAQLGYTAFAVLIVLPVIFGFRPGSVLGRALTAPAVVYVGAVSYGIYLWHNQLVSFVHDDWLGSAGHRDVLLVVVVVFAASLAIASVSWFLLERPLLGWSRRRGPPLHR